MNCDQYVKESKVKFALEQAMKAPQRASRGIFNLSLTSAQDGSGWLTPYPGRFSPGITRHPKSLGGPQGRSGRVRKNLTPTGIRSPERPASGESLYRLSYSGPHNQELFRIV
jgi:hypothetical protein